MQSYIRKTSFIWNFALRDLRGCHRRFALFLMSLALGVFAIAAVETLSHSIVSGLHSDAGLLLGGDVEVRLVQRPATARELEFLKSQSNSISRTVEMRTMAIPPISSVRPALISLKAVDSNYPLYGALKTEPPVELPDLLGKKNNVWGAVVDPILMKKLEARIGITIKVGDAAFEIRGIIIKEPDKAGNLIQFGPRFMISIDALNDTGLILPGSQIKYFYRLLLNSQDTKSQFKDRIETLHPTAGWRVRDTRDAVPGVKRFVDRMTLFLDFVGLTILLVGGVGVSVGVRAYLETKIHTIAMLKCLGTHNSAIFAIYLIQVLIMALVAILFGVIMGWLIPQVSINLLGSLLPVKPVLRVYVGPLFLASIFGFVTAATFALWPIGQAHDISPAQLFRSKKTPLANSPPFSYLIAVFLGVFSLILIILLETEETSFAWWFIGGVVSTFLILNVSSIAIKAAARNLSFRNPLLRLATTNLHRPNSPIRVVMLSLGLGLSVLLSVVLIEGNLTKIVTDRQPGDAPAFFFIDIQPSQIEKFDQIIQKIEYVKRIEKAASVRGRIIRIGGKPITDVYISPDSEWAVRSDRALTYAAHPATETKIVRGNWWPENYSGPPLISLDANLAKGFGIDVGDTITFNVLGQEITAKVKNLREIDWKTLRFNFAIIFAPGTLEDTPHSYIAAVHTSKETELEIEQAIIKQFSNVSIIRVGEALNEAERILSGLGLGLKSLAFVTLIAGILVLAGTFAASQSQKINDTTILKVFGATRLRITTIFLLEYGLLAMITCFIAVIISGTASWAVTTFLFHSKWQWIPEYVIYTTIPAIVFTMGIGMVGTLRALSQKVTPYLRNN